MNDTVQSILTPFRVEVKQNVIRWHFDSAVLTISRTNTLVVCYCNPNGKLSTHYMCFVNTGRRPSIGALVPIPRFTILFLPDILPTLIGIILSTLFMFCKFSISYPLFSCFLLRLPECNFFLTALLTFYS